MKEYNTVSESIKVLLEDAVSSDPYGLKPETLYKNIAGSTGSDEKLAEIFDVSLSLVMMIREENSSEI